MESTKDVTVLGQWGQVDNYSYLVCETINQRKDTRQPNLQDDVSNANETADVGHVCNRESTTIQDLPNSLLQYIFSFLDVSKRFQIELVCRKWRLILKLLPWKTPRTLVFASDIKRSSLRMPSYELTDQILTSLFSRCASCLTEFSLCFDTINYVSLTCKSIEAIGVYCKNLETLTLIGVPADITSLQQIAKGCRKLKKIEIAINSRHNNFEAGVLDIIRNSEALESLRIGHLHLQNEWFDVVNTKLKVLEMGTCTFSQYVLKNLVTNCDSVEELGFYFPSEMEDGALSMFMAIRHFKETLKKLRLYLYSRPEGTSWCEVLKELYSLEELAIVVDHEINDSVLEVLAQECVQLHTLVLAGTDITDKGLEHLESLSNLKVLDLSWNWDITSKGLSRLASRGIFEELYLCFVPSLREKFCCSLAKLCPNLRVLDVSMNGRIITNRLVAIFRAHVLLKAPTMPIKLFVAQTSVTSNVKRCPKLELQFSSKYPNILGVSPLAEKMTLKSYRNIFKRINKKGMY